MLTQLSIPSFTCADILQRTRQVMQFLTTKLSFETYKKEGTALLKLLSELTPPVPAENYNSASDSLFNARLIELNDTFLALENALQNAISTRTHYSEHANFLETCWSGLTMDEQTKLLNVLQSAACIEMLVRVKAQMPSALQQSWLRLLTQQSSMHACAPALHAIHTPVLETLYDWLQSSLETQLQNTWRVPYFYKILSTEIWSRKAAQAEDKDKETLRLVFIDSVQAEKDSAAAVNLESAAASIAHFLYRKNKLLPQHLFDYLPDAGLKQIDICIQKWADTLGMKKIEASEIERPDGERMHENQVYRERVIQLHRSLRQHHHLQELEAQVEAKIADFEQACSQFLHRAPLLQHASLPVLESVDLTQEILAISEEQAKEHLQHNLQQLKAVLTKLWGASAAARFNPYEADYIEARKTADQTPLSLPQNPIWNQHRHTAIYDRLRASLDEAIHTSAPNWPTSALSQFIDSEIQYVVSHLNLSDCDKVLTALFKKDEQRLGYAHSALLHDTWQKSSASAEEPLFFQAVQLIKNILNTLYSILFFPLISHLKNIFTYAQEHDNPGHSNIKEPALTDNIENTADALTNTLESSCKLHVDRLYKSILQADARETIISFNALFSSKQDIAQAIHTLETEEKNILFSALHSDAFKNLHHALLKVSNLIKETHPQKSALLLALSSCFSPPMMSVLDTATLQAQPLYTAPIELDALSIFENYKEVIQEYFHVDLPRNEDENYRILKDYISEKIMDTVECIFNNDSNISTIPLDTSPTLQISELFVRDNERNLVQCVSINGEEYHFQNTHTALNTSSSLRESRHILACKLQDFCNYHEEYEENKNEFVFLSHFFTQSSLFIDTHLSASGIFSLPTLGSIQFLDRGLRSCTFYLDRCLDGSIQLNIAFQRNIKAVSHHDYDDALPCQTGSFTKWQISLKIDAKNTNKKVTLVPAESFYHYSLEQAHARRDSGYVLHMAA